LLDEMTGDGICNHTRKDNEMTLEAPVTDLDTRFSTPDAKAISWSDAEEQLKNAGVFWVSTVRPEGRPHVVPLLAVWLEGALYFGTSAGEQKAKNLATNTQVTITTGCNSFSEGLDIVVEGEATVVHDGARLRRLRDAFVAKYGEGWRFPEGPGILFFEVTPIRAFGFGRGDVLAGGPWTAGARYNQTRWRF
jgi:nitroimidazol reductase NimA-like FMN-containing flavoprotein (pyridoxamine 5'-phosphate oxidase superfamily)